MTAIFPVPNLQVTDHLADARHTGLGTVTPYLIVLHATGGVDSVDWLSRSKGSVVSSKRVITKKGENIKILQDGQVANTQGYGVMGHYNPAPYDLFVPDGNGGYEHIHVPHVANMNTICRELELENMNNGTDPYPEAQLIMTARQCIEWQSESGFPGAIVSHAMIDNRKNDPLNFPWRQFSELYWRIIKDYVSVWKP